MYHRHFGLNRSPFSIDPDPAFLWLGEKHQEGLSVLRYGILENKGFLLLTGDAGTGKTVLIRSLLADLTEDVTVAVIPDPSLAPSDFLTILSNELGMPPSVAGKAAFLIEFKKLIRRLYSSGKRLLIIIDEAQRLTSELLDEIRVLSNIDFDNRKPVNIFFVGQIEFNPMLQDPANRALRQRITVSYHLQPLNLQETDAYIRHRLKVAGTQKELFIPKAVHEVFRFSNGTPRLTNILCDRALISGYIRGLDRIGPEIIRECARELEICSGAETTVEIGAAAVEKPAEIEEKADQTKTAAKPSGRRGNGLSAAAFGAAALILAGVFLAGVTENNRPREAGPAEGPSLQSRPAIKTNPKDSPAATRPMVSGGRENQGPPERGSVKSPAEGPEKVDKPIGTKEHRFLLFFKRGSAELEEGSYKALQQVTAVLSAFPDAEVFLTLPPSQEDRPGLSAKLLELRATSIKSVFAAQQKFKGKITVTDSLVPDTAGDQEPSGRSLAKPWAEIRVAPGLKSQATD